MSFEHFCKFGFRNPVTLACFKQHFPVNTAGGQLSFGQAGMAGGMHHVVDGARQVMGRSAEAQVADCNTAFVTGNGGIMSEQVALILVGGR